MKVIIRINTNFLISEIMSYKWVMSVFRYKSLRNHGGLLLFDIPAVERFITEDLCHFNVANSYITNERIIMIVKVDYPRTTY